MRIEVMFPRRWKRHQIETWFGQRELSSLRRWDAEAVVHSVMKTLIFVILISPLSLAGLVLWSFLLWNDETAGGVSCWTAFKAAFFRLNHTEKLRVTK